MSSRNVLVIRCSKLDAHATREVRGLPLSRFQSYNYYSSKCLVKLERETYLADERGEGRVGVSKALTVDTVVLDRSLLHPWRDNQSGNTEKEQVHNYKMIVCTRKDVPNTEAVEIEGIVLPVSRSFGIGKAIRVGNVHGRWNMVSKSLLGNKIFGE